MIHTIKIDDATPYGKKVLNQLNRFQKGVQFEDPSQTGIIPAGYMTSEEFKKRAAEKINKFCDDNGIL
jgi:hypothetical protein